MGTIIEKVAFLDLTEASEDTLKEIKAIKKVAFMVYNEKFEKFMPKISFSKISASVKVAGKFTFINGKTTFDQNFASGIKEPLSFFVNGKMIVKPDVTVEMIDKAIGRLVVNGVIYCPESTQGAIQQKAEQTNGKIVAYLNDAVLEDGKLTIDNDYLKQLKPGVNLVVTNKVTMIEDLDAPLFDEKLNQVQFLKGAVISEANKEMLSRKLANHTEKIVTVPEGFTYIDEDLHLDSDGVKRQEQGKFYVTGTVRFDKDVAPEEIKNHIAEIIAEEAIYCRTELKAEVLEKCGPSVKVISYSGDLRIIDGQHTLMKTELEYTESKIFYVVQGVLEVHKNVDPQLLYEKVERIDLDGVVSGNTEQCGVLQTKLGIQNGVVSNEDEENKEQETETPAGDDTYISKVSHLKL